MTDSAERDGASPGGEPQPQPAGQTPPPAEPSPGAAADPPSSARWLREEFVASFAAGASSLLGADVGLRLTGSAGRSRGGFVRAVEEPTCCYVLRLAEVDPSAAGPAGTGGAVVLEFSPGVAFAAVEASLGGGSACTPAPRRALTAVERGVLYRVAEMAAASLSAVLPGVGGRRLGAERELHGDALAATDEPVVVVAFEMDLCGCSGTLRLCGAREALGGIVPAARGAGEPAGPLELSAALEGIGVDADELAGLEAGDIVATEVPADGEVVVRLGGIPKFAARLGTSGERKALTITRRLDEPEPTPQQPEE